jgi:Domain of unknown function (DUF4286)
MIIYAVQVTITDQAEANWLKFMLETHIPEVMQTHCFLAYEILRQTDFISRNESRYVIHYRCADLTILQQYFDTFATALREDVQKHFAGEFSAERFIYEVA